jgi:biopolymer transport protein ExbD
MAIPPRRWVGYTLVIAGLSLLFDTYTFLRTNWSPLHVPMFAPTELALGYSLAVVGVAVLLAPVVIRLADSCAPDASLKMGEGIAHESVELRRQRRARKLPLRRPISGLPGFGLVGGISYALIAIVMMMMTSAFVYTPQGVWVRLLKRGAVPQNSDPWTEPLVVLAKDSGLGQRPNLYVNSKLVAWEDFDHVLKQELSRRREWVVYVGGDDTVAWQDVVNLIDVARRDHATAYLITGPQNP